MAPGAANGSIHPPSPAPPNVEPQILVEYLKKVLTANLDASEHDLQAPGSLLAPSRVSDTLRACSRFAAENQTVIYVVKDRPAENTVNGFDAPDGMVAHGR